MKRRTILLAGAAAAAAGAGLSAWRASRPPTGWDEDFDVIAVGGGAAGLSAAATSAAAGASVLLLEKEPQLGGDTLISGGNFNAVDPASAQNGLPPDSEALFLSQILDSGAGLNSPDVAAALATGASGALAWLKSLGMRFLPGVREIYGGRFPRAHKPVLPRGEGYIRALLAECERRKVQIRLSSPVRSLIRAQDGRVLGVAVTDNGAPKLIRARRGVIIASGGYGSSRDMLKTYAPDFADLPHDNAPGVTGEMILAGRQAGATVMNMNLVECIPGSGQDSDGQIRLDIAPTRMIMVDSRGRRFVDETDYRARITQAILKLTPRRCWSIADSDTVASYDLATQKSLHRGLHAGTIFRARTPVDLAAQIGVPPRVLAQTMNEMRLRRGLRTPPFWAAPVNLRVHATLGGLKIDSRGRCLDPSGLPIPGLWAAGAATGNVHGANRLGGNGINTAVVFGRAAGEDAARA
ncbi:MAG: FAD-dependent oxidoreductase [Mesosutterella sp.]|nr:FAD-dependent oxidoreductase [Mesosutterella sp.]